MANLFIIPSDYQFKDFSSRLGSLLEIHGISRTVFGQKVGLSRQTVSRYTNGETKPDLVPVVKIAQYFQVTMEWLLNISVDGKTDPAHDTFQILDLYNRASEEDRSEVRDILWKYRSTWTERSMFP